MKPPTRAQYPFVGRVGPIGLADKKSLGRPTRRLSQHPMGKGVDNSLIQIICLE